MLFNCPKKKWWIKKDGMQSLQLGWWTVDPEIAKRAFGCPRNACSQRSDRIQRFVYTNGTGSSSTVLGR
jgi:hypothetical protein